MPWGNIRKNNQIIKISGCDEVLDILKTRLKHELVEMMHINVDDNENTENIDNKTYLEVSEQCVDVKDPAYELI